MAYFDDQRQPDLFKRDLAHPNWSKIAVIVAMLAFWIAVIALLKAVF